MVPALSLEVTPGQSNIFTLSNVVAELKSPPIELHQGWGG